MSSTVRIVANHLLGIDQTGLLPVPWNQSDLDSNLSPIMEFERIFISCILVITSDLCRYLFTIYYLAVKSLFSDQQL